MVIFLILCLVIYNFFEISHVKIKNLVINSKKIKNEIRILQISDFHDNKFINLNKLKVDIDKVNPHIIALTGDLICRNTKNFKRLKEFLSILQGYSVFFVEGNHEFDNSKSINEILEAKNVINLTNKAKEILIGDSKITIYGNGYFKPIDMKLSKNFNLLLSHRIEDYLKNEKEYDLVLCGHTHGGQVRLPYFGQIIDHGGLFPKYSKGKYKINKSIVYIDGGIGQSIPIRINDRVMMSVIYIR